MFLSRSWEARLSSLYSGSKALLRPAQGSPWFTDVPHVECRRAAATATLSQSSVQPGGAVTRFDVPDGAAAAGLNVSEFSALVTFVCPGNTNTVLAYWDLEGQSVTYHRTDAPAVPVQRSAEEHLCLLLKRESDLWPHETEEPSISGVVQMHWLERWSMVSLAGKPVKSMPRYYFSTKKYKIWSLFLGSYIS